MTSHTVPIWGLSNLSTSFNLSCIWRKTVTFVPLLRVRERVTGPHGDVTLTFGVGVY